MDAQFLAKAKQADLEREIVRLRLVAAATGDRGSRKPVPMTEVRPVRPVPLRLLHALHLVP